MKLEEVAEAYSAGILGQRVIPLEGLLAELPSVTVLPIVERRIRHGARFTVPVAQLKPGHAPASQEATSELDSGRWKPACLRVFSREAKLIAIAQAVVPRIYQPVVVLETSEPAA
jgi:hypothetical protein